MIKKFLLSAGKWSENAINFLQLSKSKHNLKEKHKETDKEEFFINEDPENCDTDTIYTNLKIKKNKTITKEEFEILKKQIESHMQITFNIEELKNIVEGYNSKILLDASKKTLFNSGNNKSDIMIIGDHPSEEDDKSNTIFSEENGILLKKMLNYIGIKMDDVYLTNVSYWYPIKNRQLTKLELDLLYLILEKHIQLKNPKIILLLGSVAANVLIHKNQENESLNSMRKKLHYFTTLDQVKIPVSVTLHPSFLKRFSQFNNEAKKDMEMFKEQLTKNLITS